MEHRKGSTLVRLVKGDITEQHVDAIVNAANAELEIGGGVDGAIHRAGGPTIHAEVVAARETLEGKKLAPGRAIVTGAGDLPARFVVHTVGPRWVDGQRGENVTLERAYAESLGAAVKAGARSIAFPSIATGAYGFPLEPAALIALGTVFRFLRENADSLDEVRLVLFGDDDYAAYEKAFGEVIRTHLGT